MKLRTPQKETTVRNTTTARNHAMQETVNLICFDDHEMYFDICDLDYHLYLLEYGAGETLARYAISIGDLEKWPAARDEQALGTPRGWLI